MMLRVMMLAGILCAACVPSCAHDLLWGLLKCYNGHCPQDTLVFGSIVKEDARSFTIKVQKCLRGDEEAGRSIRVEKAGCKDMCSGLRPGVGEAIAVSYKRRGQAPPYRPHLLVRSSTPTWQTMAYNGNRENGDIAAIERFIRSGGVDDDFAFANGEAFLLGTPERIYPRPPGTDDAIDIPAPTTNSTAPTTESRQTAVPRILMIVTPLVLIGLLLAVIARRKRKV